VQHKLIEYSATSYEIYAELGPKNSDALYAPYVTRLNGSDVALIRQELQSFNETQCPINVISAQMSQGAQPSTICQATPGSFCSSVENDHINDAIFPVAISNECVVPTLVRLRKTAEVEQSRVERALFYKHSRHIFYMIFSVLAGTKIAGATAKFAQATIKLRGFGRERPLSLLARAVFLITRRFFVALLKTLVAWTRWFIRALESKASRLIAPEESEPHD
jgi:hypothetical protein